MFWGRVPGRRPQDFVRRDVPGEARRIVAVVLAAGRDVHPDLQAMGWADCRICGRRLGTRDLGSLGLVWPERADHYVRDHAVWTPGCSDLLFRVAHLVGSPTDDGRESSGRILFWSRAVGGRPQDFVREDVPREARRVVAAVLSAGREVACYKGSAECRLCGQTLGIRDLGALGLVWPECAEHYVLDHAVWTPGCSELLSRAVESCRATSSGISV